jgi:3-oxoacyl-[acyl-carrier-protein] synthase II
MRAQRLAVTGVGIVSALGQSAPETFRALMAGQRGLRPLTLFDAADVRSQLVAEVPSLRVADVAPPGRADDFSRTDAMAVLAAREAAQQARLPRGGRLGVALGGTTGGMFETEGLLSSPELAALLPEQAAKLMSFPLSASLLRVSEALGGSVVSRSICSACSSGAIALVQAAAWLLRGDVDFALAGGADGLCRMTVYGFNALGATDPGPCRPFDRARAGLNLGEGAGLVVLEREESAVRRGAEVLAWLDGFAIGAEAHHITHPEASGARAARLMRQALARAGLSAEDLGYVNAHGTGTRQNDAMEAQALLEVLGGSADKTWVSSSKAQLGHTLGASGAVEAALTVVALARGEVPPTAGLVEPEVGGLRHVLATGQAAAIDSALSSSFGFGGMSCVLAFAASGTAAPPVKPGVPRVIATAGLVLGADVEPEKELDPERSRRFDRGSALAAAGSAALLRERPGVETGLVLGTAFGNVERTMAFLARARERGPRQVPPAEFPHLVPSAPAGNASVYAGLTGPVFAVGDLGQTGEAAIAAGCELIELGAAERLVVGAIAPRDAIVERVLGPLLEPSGFTAASRGTGAGLVLLEAEWGARAGVVVLASCRGSYDVPGLSGLPAMAPSAASASLVLLAAASRQARDALEQSSWAGVARRELTAEHGYHEALGALALAEAVRVLQDEGSGVDTALVLAGDVRNFTAILLSRSSGASE